MCKKIFNIFVLSVVSLLVTRGIVNGDESVDLVNSYVEQVSFDTESNDSLDGDSLERAPMAVREESTEEDQADYRERQLLLLEELKSLEIVNTEQKNTTLKWNPFGSVLPILAPSSYHFLVGYNVFNNTIMLEDGSVWAGPVDTGLNASTWFGVDKVKITPNNSWFSSYKFIVTNMRTNESIKLNLYSAPLLNGPYTKFITAIDSVDGYAVLNDGSLWNLSPYDQKITSKWYVYDTVIIGVNSDVDYLLRPNILINIAINPIKFSSCSLAN